MALFDRLFGAKPEENLEESTQVEEAVQEETAPEILEETDAVAEAEPALTPEQEALKAADPGPYGALLCWKSCLAAWVQEVPRKRWGRLAIQTKEAVEVPAEPGPVHETDQENMRQPWEDQKGLWGPPQWILCQFPYSGWGILWRTGRTAHSLGC